MLGAADAEWVVVGGVYRVVGVDALSSDCSVSGDVSPGAVVVCAATWTGVGSPGVTFGAIELVVCPPPTVVVVSGADGEIDRVVVVVVGGGAVVVAGGRVVVVVGGGAVVGVVAIVVVVDGSSATTSIGAEAQLSDVHAWIR